MDAKNLADETGEWSKESLGEVVRGGGEAGGVRWERRRFLDIFGG
jgi:hypothetical protein